MALLKGSYSIANVSPDRILKYVGKYFIVFLRLFARLLRWIKISEYIRHQFLLSRDDIRELISWSISETPCAIHSD